jgi:hypothetical protein
MQENRGNELKRPLAQEESNIPQLRTWLLATAAVALRSAIAGTIRRPANTAESVTANGIEEIILSAQAATVDIRSGSTVQRLEAAERGDASV